MADAKLQRMGNSGIRVTGNMTFTTTRDLYVESQSLVKQFKDLKLDLTEVKQADSAGLALLLEWISQARKAGGEVSLKGLPDALIALAHLCQMDVLLNSLNGD